MPAAIPVIAAWAGAASAATAIAAGTATFMSYVAVAGAVLTTVGAVTGKKDLMKAGGLMTLGAGLINGLGSAAAGEAAGEVAGEQIAGAAVDDLAAAGSMGATNTSLAENALAIDPSAGAQLGTQELGSSFAQAAAPSQASMLSTPGLSVTGATAPGVTGVPVEGVTQGLGGVQTAAGLQAPVQSSGPLDWLNNIGSNVKQNKELYQIGGQMLQGMFGPEAEQMDLQKQMIERRRKNMNTIVPLGQIGMLGKGG